MELHKTNPAFNQFKQDFKGDNTINVSSSNFDKQYNHSPTMRKNTVVGLTLIKPEEDTVITPNITHSIDREHKECPICINYDQCTCHLN